MAQQCLRGKCHRELLQVFAGSKQKPTSGPLFMSQAECFGGYLPPDRVTRTACLQGCGSSARRADWLSTSCHGTVDQLPRHWLQSSCAPVPEERAAVLVEARQRAYSLTANGSLRSEELEELRRKPDPLRALCRRLGVMVIECGEGAERRGKAGQVCILWETGPVWEYWACDFQGCYRPLPSLLTLYSRPSSAELRDLNKNQAAGAAARLPDPDPLPPEQQPQAREVPVVTKCSSSCSWPDPRFGMLM